MNNFTDPNGLYGALQVMALDYMVGWWAKVSQNKPQRAPQAEIQAHALPQIARRPVEAAPALCGC